MKKKITKFTAAILAFIVAFAPITTYAMELKGVEYNKEVTKSNGDLKLGYKETNDSTKTWWKTETYFTDWQETDEATYNSVTDKDLKKVDESGRTDWRKATKAEYDKYYAANPDLARTNGYTNFAECDKATYDAKPEDLRKAEYTDFVECDKATYDAESNADLKKKEESDWTGIASAGSFEDLYNSWLTYPEEMRRMNGRGDFYEVSKDEYLAYAALLPGYENELYKYEEEEDPTTTFPDWVFFDEQIIANVYNAFGGHDPFYVLVGEINESGYSGCEGGTWDGNNDGIRYLDFNNGGSAQNIANSTMDFLNSHGVPYVTINSGSDIPALGTNKYNQHSQDPNRNAGNDSGNGFIDIVDNDFKIYYYSGSDTIYVEELYGVLIAPNAEVQIGGKWIGTIVADTVTTKGNWHESAKWCYPVDKGDILRKYYIARPNLEVKTIKYYVRTVKYFARDYVYEVRDVVKKYYVRGLEQKKYYCETAPYVPKTGDVNSLYVLLFVCGVLVVGATFVSISSKKNRRDSLR